MVKDLFERREAYIAERAEKKKRTAKALVPVLAVCLAALAGFAVWRTGFAEPAPAGGESAPSGTESSGLPETIDPRDPGSPVIWADNGIAVPIEGLTQWGPFDSVSVGLAAALENGDGDDIFAILGRPAIDYEYPYKGKTLAQYYSDMADERNLADILSQLSKEGEELRYGTALYEGGLPEGVTGWTKEWYEERTAWYGEKILDRYLKDGAFLKDELEADLEKARQAAEASDRLLHSSERPADPADGQAAEKTRAYLEAFTAYLTDLAAAAGGRIPAEAAPCENGIVLFLTKEEFRHFTADRIEGWSFDLAFRDGGDETFAAAE